MAILVTGSSGFVGKSLIPKLKKNGYDVIGLDHKPGENTDMIHDVSKKFKIDKPIDIIIHLAARLEHERCSKKEFFSTNVDGTKNLLNFAEENNIGGIELSTAISNNTAQSLYESLNYERDTEFYNYYLSIKK